MRVCLRFQVYFPKNMFITNDDDDDDIPDNKRETWQVQEFLNPFVMIPIGCIFPLKILHRIYFISRGRWYHPWNIVVVLKLHQEFFSIAHLSKFLHSDNNTNSKKIFMSVLIILHFPLWKDLSGSFQNSSVVYYPKKTTYVLRVIKFTCRYNNM